MYAIGILRNSRSVYNCMGLLIPLFSRKKALNEFNDNFDFFFLISMECSKKRFGSVFERYFKNLWTINA